MDSKKRTTSNMEKKGGKHRFCLVSGGVFIEKKHEQNIMCSSGTTFLGQKGWQEFETRQRYVASLAIQRFEGKKDGKSLIGIEKGCYTQDREKKKEVPEAKPVGSCVSRKELANQSGEKRLLHKCFPPRLLVKH